MIPMTSLPPLASARTLESPAAPAEPAADEPATEEAADEATEDPAADADVVAAGAEELVAAGPVLELPQALATSVTKAAPTVNIPIRSRGLTVETGDLM